MVKACNNATAFQPPCNWHQTMTQPTQAVTAEQHPVTVIAMEIVMATAMDQGDGDDQPE